MKLDAPALIEKHRGRGVLLDANLLVLFLVGRLNRNRITQFKRTSSYTIKDFNLLSGLIEQLGKPLVATPHILSQVSDLIDLKDEELLAIRKLMRDLVENIEEHYEPARTLVSHPVFARLGLADAGVAAAKTRNILILTADLELYETLQRDGIESVNFNHFTRLKQPFQSRVLL